LGERLNGIQEVVGSIPIGSTIIFNSPPSGGFLLLVSPSRDLPSVARARRARPRTKTSGRSYARKPTYREDQLARDRG
jgi:hypothetical protein